MELIVMLSQKEENLGQIIGVIEKGEWDNIIIISSSGSSISTNKQHEIIKINSNQKIIELTNEIKSKLKGKIKGLEVALSIASGTGKEHMALISALLNLPVGVKFAVLTSKGVVEI